MCSSCQQNLKFGNFTLSFVRLRQRILLKCVPHVQHDYFSSFNQSDRCFLASSLPLFLPKLSSVDAVTSYTHELENCDITFIQQL